MAKTADPLFEPLRFANGMTMKNRFMLAPMTNTQSHEDGRLSDDELNWLRLRAEGGFGLTMTCASHVQAIGKGFPGQLGCFGDEHLDGLTRIASALREADSLSVLQLHHAGMRSPADLIGTRPVCPSDHEDSGARVLTRDEIDRLREDFVAAALRAEKAGFDGVEIHGAHGYILAQFLSPTINRRTDEYGGTAENRARILFEIVDEIRSRCGAEFLLGVRLSPERFDLKLAEILVVAQRLMNDGLIDFLDISLWDSFKEPEEEAFRGRSLMSYFTQLDRGNVRLGVAGKIYSASDARRCLEPGADFVLLGRAAILHHDFPARVLHDADFGAIDPPVNRAYLQSEGLGERFIDYMSGWKGFVGD